MLNTTSHLGSASKALRFRSSISNVRTFTSRTSLLSPNATSFTKPSLFTSIPSKFTFPSTALPRNTLPNFIQTRFQSTTSTDNKLRRTLTEQQEKIVAAEIELLKQVKADLDEMKAAKEDSELVMKSLQQLQDLFLLVIIGEFNSGKSSFLNALIGRRVLKEGVTPTTSKIGIIKYGSESKVGAPNDHLDYTDNRDRETITVPVDWLKDISLVDTPGTNAVVRGHTQITQNFVPRSDLVLFVTSVDRAFSDSERQFLQLVRQWKKKIIVVLSKVDILETDAELREIKEFVSNNFRELLGDEPLIFPVSSKKALNAKIQSLDAEALDNNQAWKESRFGELEKYILKTLDKEERTKLKLENPLGVMEHLLSKYSSGVQARRELLQGDLKTLQTIQEQIAEFKSDMEREYQYQHYRVDNLLMSMGKRGEEFFENQISLTNIVTLMRSDKIRAEFERDVIGDTSKDMERQVSDIIDWMLAKQGRLWADVMEYLQRRANLNSSDIMGKITMNFDYNRTDLLKTVGEGAHSVIASYDRQKESLRLSNDVKQAIVTTAAMEISALGIGSLLVGSLLDFTGILGVGAIAATGLAILPYKRATMKSAFNAKIGEMRTKLRAALLMHYEQEQQNSLRKLESAIEPYSRFVKTERERLENLEARFKTQYETISIIRHDISKAFSAAK